MKLMKKLYILLLLCVAVCNAQAQKVSRDYQDQSLSKVLEDLNVATADHTIYFIYDELEDFTVTTSFNNLPLEEAVRQVVGFYPMKVTSDGSRIFVECMQKESTKVIGHVIDEQGKPVEFANISLLCDSVFTAGGVSNENGDFVIPCNAQRVTLKVTCIGFKTASQNVSVGEVGNITLQTETYTIGGVVVKGEIPQYKATHGGMTVDIQHSILHDIGSADDLLSMLPMVQGRDGKFEVLSKGEPEIYINNKKVRNANELKQLKSTDIKSVDIITAPGAQYNAEVNAVIRIRTIKPQGDGFSLMATTQTWRNNQWNNYEDLTLKYRTGGLEGLAKVAFDWNHFSNDPDLGQELHIS